MRNKKPLKSIQYHKAEETTYQQMMENTGTTATALLHHLFREMYNTFHAPPPTIIS